MYVTYNHATQHTQTCYVHTTHKHATYTCAHTHTHSLWNPSLVAQWPLAAPISRSLQWAVLLTWTQPLGPGSLNQLLWLAGP